MLKRKIKIKNEWLHAKGSTKTANGNENTDDTA
jgi:hypothetical protein